MVNLSIGGAIALCYCYVTGDYLFHDKVIVNSASISNN